MKSFRCTKVLSCAWLLIAATTAGVLPAATPSFCGVYLVGDSVSDTGNLVALAAQYNINPIPIPPGLVLNGTRFSDGQLWVESLAGMLQLPADAGPFFALSGKNLALAGSSLLQDLSSLPLEFGVQRELSWQVETLIAANGGMLPACGLYIVFSGNNDVLGLLDAISNGALPLSALLPTLNQAVGKEMAALQALHAAGGRNFLLAGVSNVGLAPALQGNEGLGSLTAATFNAILLSRVLALQGGPRGRLWFLGTYAVANAIAVDATFFNGRKTGITNIKVPCAPVFGGPYPCSSSAFWDTVHPTMTAHQVLANAAFQLLKLRPLISNP